MKKAFSFIFFSKGREPLRVRSAARTQDRQCAKQKISSRQHERRKGGNGQRTDDNDIFNDLMPGLSAVWTHSESSEKSFCKAPSLSRKSSFSFFNLMSNPVFDVPFPVQKDYKREENR
jgi:hypothetical protein